jgi:hypothetical protein
LALRGNNVKLTRMSHDTNVIFHKDEVFIR